MGIIDLSRLPGGLGAEDVGTEEGVHLGGFRFGNWNEATEQSALLIALPGFGGAELFALNACQALDIRTTIWRYRPLVVHPLMDGRRGNIEAASKGGNSAYGLGRAFDGAVHVRMIGIAYLTCKALPMPSVGE